MHLLRELVVTTLFLLISGANAELYGKKSAVFQLDHKNFQKEILNSDNAAMVEFYAPWCGHCQNLKPAYEQAAASLKGMAKVAAIDCDDEKNKGTCGEYGIKGFPTLKLFVPSSKRGRPVVEDYNGARTAKALSDAVAERIPNHVTKLSGSKFTEFLGDKNETAKAILFTNKGTTSALWKSLAVDFLDAISFAQVRDKETAAVELMGVNKFPTIVVLPGGDAKGKVYEGKMEKQAIYDFFAAVKAPKSKDEPQSSSSPSASAAKPTPTPKTEVPSLAGLAQLRTTCFAKNSKTCILVLSSTPLAGVTDAYGKLVSRPPPHTFQVFNVGATGELATALAEKLELGSELPQLIAVHRRGWFRRFAGDAERSADILAWLDAVKMGEGVKGKVPEALMAQEEEQQQQEGAKKVEEVKEKAKEKAEEKVEVVKEKIQETTESAKEKVEEVKKAKDEL